MAKNNLNNYWFQKTRAPMKCLCIWKARHMTSSIPGLENTPRQMVFLQECHIGQILMGPVHCGLQKEGGGLQKRVILEQPHQFYIAPTLHPVLSLLDQTGNHQWLFQISMKLPSAKIELGPIYDRLVHKFSFSGLKMRLAGL